ncbi:MAG: hypothetical protein L3J69_06020 [Desulfobacula sp.]|nr:hypothetical protein [Desulfobacula sp.]
MKKGIDILRDVIYERLAEKRREDMAKDKPVQIKKTDNGDEKWCPKGKHYVKADVDHFYNDARSKTGLSSWCRKCQNKAAKSTSSKTTAASNTSEKKFVQEDMVLTLDFSKLEILYEDILAEAADQLRTPAMQVMWLASQALYKERA